MCIYCLFCCSAVFYIDGACVCQCVWCLTGFGVCRMVNWWQRRTTMLIALCTISSRTKRTHNTIWEVLPCWKIDLVCTCPWIVQINVHLMLHLVFLQYLCVMFCLDSAFRTNVQGNHVLKNQFFVVLINSYFNMLSWSIIQDLIASLWSHVSHAF